jgi:geranylgeranyl reductase family protein
VTERALTAGCNPTLVERTWDAVVIGAGPAGCTAARRLAHQGQATLVLDRHAFPRDKVCGDGLIPDAIESLRRGGLLETVEREAFHAEALAVYSPGAVRVDVAGRFLTLRRRRLDQLLLDAALDAGARFHTATVAATRSTAECVELYLRGAPVVVRAQYVVLATGADTRLRSQVTPDGAAGALALRCYAKAPVDLQELVISFDRAVLPGYAWIFPLGAGWFNMGCGVFHHGRRAPRINLRHTFTAFTHHFPIAREIWRNRSDATPLAGARLRCGLEPEASYDGKRTVAVGETIAATFPFTGEGIGKAMETAEIAGDRVDLALRRNDPGVLADYPQRLVRQVAPRYEGYRVAERWIRWPRLTDFVAARVAHSRRLQRAAAGVLSESADPRQIFSARALMPALLPWRS